MRKNILKVSAIALLSTFALASCSDDIIAKPKAYDDKNSPVVTVTGYNGTIYNNNFKDIYDAYRDGNLAQDVLNELLYQYSISVFGNYNKVTAKEGSEEITLKEAVNSYKNGDKKKADDFIKAHSAYWTKNKAGHRVDDANKEVADDAAPSESEYARLNQKWETIEKRIAEKLYSAISGGSYSERNVFKEEKYLRSLATDVENNVRALTGAELFEGVLTAAVEDYAVFKDQAENIEGNPDYILHRANYQSNAALDQAEDKEQDATYVEDKLIPDIYRQLLVEQYILDESYDTLGRTSARHISVLSITENSKHISKAEDLMKKFVNNYIFDKARTDAITLDSFKTVSEAWIGAFMRDTANQVDTYPAYKLSVEAFGTPAQTTVQGVDYKYFEGTNYGNMMEEFKKIDNNPKLSENESTYTNSGAYTVKVGQEIKTRELQLKDYTSTGWYVKSVGVSDLPDNIKNQLFDINVANALLGEDCVEYSYDTTANEWKTNEVAGSKNLVNVVGKINNQYFLRKTSRVADEKVQNDILFKSDNTYYLVLVEDAIKSKVLNKATYAELEGNELTDAMNKLENYINEIVQLVASNDTYQTLSKKHWVEKMDIKYHDTKVYDYFKSTFPELFD